MMDEKKPTFGEFQKSDNFRINNFYRACQQDRRPAIWLESRRKLINLFWDLESVPVEWIITILRDGHAALIFEQLWSAFIAVGSDRATFSGSFGTGAIFDLPIDRAQSLAGKFSQTLEREALRAQRLVQHA